MVFEMDKNNQSINEYQGNMYDNGEAKYLDK